jgi:hypothetical protein
MKKIIENLRLVKGFDNKPDYMNPLMSSEVFDLSGDAYYKTYRVVATFGAEFSIDREKSYSDYALEAATKRTTNMINQMLTGDLRTMVHVCIGAIHARDGKTALKVLDDMLDYLEVK